MPRRSSCAAEVPGPPAGGCGRSPARFSIRAAPRSRGTAGSAETTSFRDEFLQDLDAFDRADRFGTAGGELHHFAPHPDRVAVDAGIGESDAEREVGAVRARTLADHRAQQVDRLVIARLRVE